MDWDKATRYKWAPLWFGLLIVLAPFAYLGFVLIAWLIGSQQATRHKRAGISP